MRTQLLILAIFCIHVCTCRSLDRKKRDFWSELLQKGVVKTGNGVDVNKNGFDWGNAFSVLGIGPKDGVGATWGTDGGGGGVKNSITSGGILPNDFYAGGTGFKTTGYENGQSNNSFGKEIDVIGIPVYKNTNDFNIDWGSFGRK